MSKLLTNETRKYLVIFAGGTIVMRKDHEKHVLDQSGGQILYNFLRDLKPVLGEGVSIKTMEMFNLDSTDMEASHWELMADAVLRGVEQGYNGILITMGTNTLAYAASALTFALLGIKVPVILTGAQIPAREITSDARNNFMNAIRVMTEHHLEGVFVVFGSRIIRGCRAKKVSEWVLDAFVSYNSADFGSIGVDLRFKGVPRPVEPIQGSTARFERNVTCITLTPGIQEHILQLLIDGGAKGIIIRAYGSGDVPERLLPGLSYAQDRQVPVVVTTQCPDGATMIGINPPGMAAMNLGIIPSGDMSMEAMTTKLMWLLAQRELPHSIGDMMISDLAGEVSEALFRSDLIS